MDKWAANGKQLFALLDKFDAMPEESPNADLAGEVLDFLEMSELDRFYAHTIKRATACLPKGEVRPVTKELAEMWMRRMALAARNPDEAKKVVDEFDQWKKTRTFKDREMGARLHLATALILAARTRLPQRGRPEVQRRSGFSTARPHGAVLSRTVQPVPRRGQTGSDACQFRDGLLHRPRQLPADQPPRYSRRKEIKVRPNGETDMYAAKLIADNEPGDMAILKIELPAGKQLAIPLMANESKIGEDVSALGWPGMMSHNATLTLTKGVVSTLPDADDSEGFIVTDSIINQGSSGGPLCSFSGGVAGMVTRRPHIASSDCSYGCAIPVGRLRKFVTEKLPHDARMPSAQAAKAAKMKVSDLAEKIGPSVVYIENIQEMHLTGQGQEPK